MAFHGRDRLYRYHLDPSGASSASTYSRHTPAASSSSSSSPLASSPLVASHSYSESYFRVAAVSADYDSSPTLPCARQSSTSHLDTLNPKNASDSQIVPSKRVHRFDSYAYDVVQRPPPTLAAVSAPRSHDFAYDGYARSTPGHTLMSSSPQPPHRDQTRPYPRVGSSKPLSLSPGPSRKYWTSRRNSAYADSDYELPPLTSDLDQDSDGEAMTDVDQVSASHSHSKHFHMGSHAHSHAYPRSRQSADLSSSPSKPHHHRRTQSSPFRYASRVSPFAPAHDERPHYLQQSSSSQTYAPYRESSARFSPYPASVPPAPPRTASSIASSSILDHTTDDEDDISRHVDEDVDQSFAFSPTRRRISFSTSAERDSPIAPPMPVVPPAKLTSLWANRRSRERVGLEDERVGRDRERKPQEMLPTPPMSSPELEVAQPLPSSSRRNEVQQPARLPSQPVRREPSIPVGSLTTPTERGFTPLRERKRKERPTLMDLLSSPQPSVSPERPPTSSSYLAPSPDPGVVEERPTKRTVLSPLREDLHVEKPVEQPNAGPLKIARDGSLPPSSPLSTPFSSPVKSSLPSSSPRRSVSPAPVSERVDETWDSSPLSSPLSSPVRASSVTVRISRSPSVDMQATARLRPLELPREDSKDGVVSLEAKHQLPTPMTPEFASNPLVQHDQAENEEMELDEVTSSSRLLIEPEQRHTPSPSVSPQSPSPSAAHADMPSASSSTPRPLISTPTITTIQITLDMKTEEDDDDVEMHDVSDIVAPSSPLSEISSPSLGDRAHASGSHASPSDIEDERASSPVEKRKSPPSPRKGLMRKKMRVDSVSSVDVLHSERDHRSASGSDDSESEAEQLIRKPATRGRGRGRGRGRSARATTSKRKAISPSEASDEDDEKSHLPTPSATPDQDEDVQATKPKRPFKKQAKRRVASPSGSGASRSPSPAPSHRERSKAPARKRSMSSKPKASQYVDWEAVSPLAVPELEGMIIETLATARATSLSASVLYDALLRARPALKSMNRRMPDEQDEETADQEPDTSPLNKREWLQLLTYVCTAGHFSSGVFGRVDSSASDSDGPSSKKKRSPWANAVSMAAGSVSKTQLYEIARTKYAQRAQWYYIPEKDVDKDRASVVKSMMRGPGKRSETMKYKRYYWKPLGKISRWDREDDL